MLVSVGFPLALNKFLSSQTIPGCPAMDLSGGVDPSQTVAIWQDQTVTPPKSLTMVLGGKDRRVLGTTSAAKWIEIDLTAQRLTAHQGDEVFLESPISSGLWNRTPVGEFEIYYKITSTKMEGGSRLNKTYYYLPNVPFSMFFFGDFGIHGTYWHSNFGTPMSHGCVNAPTGVAEKLFYWSGPHIEGKDTIVRSDQDNPGTKVVIHY
ncbi:hypothetical protein A2397_05505 [Candidatus Amesbacteria bacterium RIFOXYB1_FULL_44_23]|uniref:L,D-TPase catalytic domain-containing protein n=1 Tax=Candidatus Amesbacteria bacterium RIFOXYB1_FULL_44_23 TaxID=1797263 RepID=A0A1F4ZPG5_9BACT|nr:MAG: hypothetical protein A2397_05505 [Candidatus Amesbacteria bacterium RIFOXYB1_FULL_44_23]